MDTLIDICVPTYNTNAAYIKQALDSVLAQTEQRWRVYLHDDNSKNDVRALVEPYMHDQRFMFVKSNKWLGIGGNWNASMRLGNAPYVQFLFQDDWWEPHFLETGLRVMEAHPDVGMVALEHEYYCEEGPHTIPVYKELEEFRRTHLKPGLHDGRETLRYWLERELHPNIIGEPDFVLLRRSLMEKVGPYLEDMPQNLDMEYSLRCLLHTNWYYIPERTGFFRVHSEAMSAVNQREGKGVFDRFRCFEEVIPLITNPHDRKIAVAARNRALEDMAAKFLKRRKSGGQVKAGGKGAGAFKKFALQHPFLVSRAMWKGYRKNKT